jgi:uroporphyrinogen-III synthase
LRARSITVVTCPTVETRLLGVLDQRALRKSLLEQTSPSTYIAFTSRMGIEGSMRACGPRLRAALRRGDLTAIALGADAEALIAHGVPRDRIISPKDASPSGIVEEMCMRVPRRFRTSTSIRCPVPRVVGLAEPPVVPKMVQELRRAGFSTSRFPAYETRWPGPSKRARRAMTRLAAPDAIDAIALTSTAEAEGLLRLAELYGVRRCVRDVPVVVHGPVTAAGARSIGLYPAAVNKRYATFAGLADTVDALCTRRIVGAWILRTLDESWLLD